MGFLYLFLYLLTHFNHSPIPRFVKAYLQFVHVNVLLKESDFKFFE